ncbi:Hypothetical protein LOCK919_2417 [Lacticaseibacillus paracasei]|nr:Hypothetical protein LOCK919_2417 [Lacticaseibacillus paracasei]
MDLNVMAGFGPLHSGSLHAGRCAGERVMTEREPARLVTEV